MVLQSILKPRFELAPHYALDRQHRTVTGSQVPTSLRVPKDTGESTAGGEQPVAAAAAALPAATETTSSPAGAAQAPRLTTSSSSSSYGKRQRKRQLPTLPCPTGMRPRGPAPAQPSPAHLGLPGVNDAVVQPHPAAPACQKDSAGSPAGTAAARPRSGNAFAAHYVRSPGPGASLPKQDVTVSRCLLSRSLLS